MNNDVKIGAGLAFSVPNTSSGHDNLQRRLGPDDSQIIALEPTGGYEWALWEALDIADYDVRRVPDMTDDKPAKKKFNRYPIGYVHIDIAEVRTDQGKLRLFVAIDRTS